MKHNAAVSTVTKLKTDNIEEEGLVFIIPLRYINDYIANVEPEVFFIKHFL